MSPAVKRSLIIALIGSFAVYLLPLVTPHVTMTLGTALWAEITRGPAAKGVLWLAADIALALALQAAAFALIFWVARRPSIIRALALIASVPVFFYGAMAGYLLAIPTLFLIEGERHAAHGAWPVACTVAGAELLADRGGPDVPLARAGEAWLVRQKPGGGLGGVALLTGPDCATRELPVTLFRSEIRQTVPGGGALVGTLEKGASAWSYSVVGPDGRRHELSTPPGVKYWRPLLSQDARTLAWLQREAPGDKRNRRVVLVVQQVGGQEVERIPVRQDRPAALRVIGFDATKTQFVARRNERHLVAIDTTGRVTPLAEAPRPGRHPTHRVVRLANGWVSWDIYRDEGRARVAWKLGGHEGLHEVPKGRGIRAVSVSPDGRLIAVSVGRNLRIGSMKDAVYVLRASDGKEVFRLFLPAYARSQPAFLGPRHLAVTQLADGRASVEVLRVPERLAAR